MERVSVYVCLTPFVYRRNICVEPFSIHYTDVTVYIGHVLLWYVCVYKSFTETIDLCIELV